MTTATLQTRCIVSSAVAHVGVLVALLAGSAWATRRVMDTEPILPPIEMVSLEGVRLTDGVGAGGGTPTPPPPQPRTTQPTTPPPAAPPAAPRQQNREVRVAPTPVRAAPPEREVRVSPNAVRSQDTQPDAPRVGRRPVQVAATSQRVSPAESQAAQQAAQQAANRAAERAAAARERAAREASERWRAALGGIRSQLAEGLSGQTDISVPGPGGGGEVWMGYASYLKAFYEARWRRPSSLPVPVAYVGVAVTVARDGRMTRFELLEKSGIKTLDDSVLELVQRHRQLEPLPSGSSDAERTFRIKFRLEGTTQ